MKHKKRSILAISIGICVAAIAYLLIAYLGDLPPFQEQKSSGGVNMNRTDTEIQATDNLEKNPASKLENNQTDTPQPPGKDENSGKKVVNVLITNVGISSGTVSASGFVTNIVESDGSCTYTFTNGNNTVNKVVGTLPNATSTTCKTTTFSSDELPTAGTWSVVLSYNSTQSMGQSSARDVQK